MAETTATASQPPPARRRRRSSLAAAILDSAQKVESSISHTLLLTWDALEHWRRDNAYIQTGYRPTSHSYRVSLQSLAYLHNESVNIWSHLVGAAGFALGGLYLRMLVAPRYGTASGADVLVFGCFFAGAFACLGMSATYHAVSNHSAEVAK